MHWNQQNIKPLYFWDSLLTSRVYPAIDSLYSWLLLQAKPILALFGPTIDSEIYFNWKPVSNTESIGLKKDLLLLRPKAIKYYE